MPGKWWDGEEELFCQGIQEETEERTQSAVPGITRVAKCNCWANRRGHLRRASIRQPHKATCETDDMGIRGATCVPAEDYEHDCLLAMHLCCVTITGFLVKIIG